MNFRCPKASRMKSPTAAFAQKTVRGVRRIENRDGIKQDRRAAGKFMVGTSETFRHSFERRRPWERLISRVAPSASSAFRKAPISFASTPSVTSAPTLRPAKLFGPFRTMLKGFDFSRSERTSTAGVAALIFPLSPRPAATCSARPSIDVRKMGNHPFADRRFFDLA